MSPHSPVARALLRHAAANGLCAEVRADEARPWASATFVGARHALRLLFKPSPALDAWVAALPETELPVRGGHLADLVVTDAAGSTSGVVLALTALVIDEA